MHCKKWQDKVLFGTQYHKKCHISSFRLEIGASKIATKLVCLQENCFNNLKAIPTKELQTRKIFQSVQKHMGKWDLGALKMGKQRNVWMLVGFHRAMKYK